jgi:hypothetical protein
MPHYYASIIDGTYTRDRFGKHVRNHFPDDDRGEIGIRSRTGREGRRVGDSQALHAEDPTLSVDHGSGIMGWPHSTGARTGLRLHNRRT